MFNVLKGKRPDFTPAQFVATLIAGVPVISNLLAAFGVFDPTPVQQDALTNTINWAVPFAGFLVGGDVAVRAARNAKDAKVEAAALSNGITPPIGPDLDREPAEDEPEPTALPQGTGT